jgi:hypothetical protein
MMSEFFILNPLLPLTAFPYTSSEDTVSFALIYDKQDEQGNNLVKSSTLDSICEQAKIALSMNYFDWGAACGRYLLKIKSLDIPRIYRIVQWFLQHGHRIYMQDGTQTTFNPEHAETIGPDLHQQLLLQSCKELQRCRLPLTLINLPLQCDDFWLIQQGKQFASELRALNFNTNDDGLFIGEALYAKQEQHRKIQMNNATEVLPEPPGGIPMNNTSAAVISINNTNERAAVLPVESEMCCICLLRPPNTMVLPCQHIVVCFECSTQLKTDPINQKLCVYCRTSIEEILDEQAIPI